ncbi:hypothetical protein EZV62_005102 [Acer yangbiense]|uniref:BHLH domain-containing protein n=1 Tax=Acer yangbiense TaxID=1000413 RepID=A0A5C7IL87_9ROSI|nr:hypothetical protein EZV62_005102 [Acer yangbiense]
MCALTPTHLFQSFEWPLDNNPINHQNNYLITQNFESLFSNFDQSDHQLHRSNPTMVKKLYHNASERDRRKKVNTLYSSLRSLLPAADQTKKLSIPVTISRALRYIPELEQQLENLIQKKEELLSRKGNVIHHQEKQRKGHVGSSFFSISVSRLSDNEVVIQISTYKLHKNPLSEILLHLEDDHGLLLVDASSFESSGGRLFYTLHLDQNKPQVQLDHSASFNTHSSGDPTTVKKFYHNASERDRRKKINTLYSSLRSLLPANDHTKKLSIPGTISHVLKYIPELQQQVESLIQKKEEVLSRISSSRQEGEDVIIHQEKQRKSLVGSSLFSISARRLSDSEVVIQISSYKLRQNPLSEILFNLEEDGLLLINASSFESSAGRVFYNLHLQVERTYLLECEVLSEKLLSSYEKNDMLYK